MQVVFSRHARRRASLYKIPEAAVCALVLARELTPGAHEFLEEMRGFEFPIKVVAVVDGNVATVVTCYPLKKGRKA